MSLSHLLQVRGSALNESELWAILAETAAMLQCASPQILARITISPSTLVLGQNGGVDVQMAHHQAGIRSTVFIAPDVCHEPAFLEHAVDVSRLCRFRAQRSAFDTVELLQAHIYSLGITLYYAADYNVPGHVHPQLSTHLEQLVAQMVHERPTDRCKVEDVVKACHNAPHEFGDVSHRRRIATLAAAAPQVQSSPRTLSAPPVTTPPVSLPDSSRVRSPATPSRKTPRKVPSSGTRRSQSAGNISNMKRTPRRSSALHLQPPVSIALLDGRLRAFRPRPDSTVRDVFQYAARESGLLDENWIFGISIADENGNERLLPMSELLRVVLPPERRSPLKFRVEFYLENFNVLQQLNARHLYFLQAKSDIVSGYLYAAEERSEVLAAYAIQAELGDYDARRHVGEYYRLESYFSPQIIAAMGANVLKQHVPELHRQFLGMSRPDAEKEYLLIVQKLPDFGVMFHALGTSKSSPESRTYLGVGARGVFSYDEKNGRKRLSDLRLPWKSVGEVHSKGKRIKIFERRNKAMCHQFVASSKEYASYIAGRIGALGEFRKLVLKQYPDTRASRASIHEPTPLPLRDHASTASLLAASPMATSPNPPSPARNVVTPLAATPKTILPLVSPTDATEDNPVAADLQRRMLRSHTPEPQTNAHGDISSHISPEAIQFCESQLDEDGQRLYGDPRQLRIRADSEGRLGFTIVGGMTQEGGATDSDKHALFVKEVQQNRGGAKNVGLQYRDRLLEINGENVVFATHEYAVKLLRRQSEVALVVATKLKTKMNKKKKKAKPPPPDPDNYEAEVGGPDAMVVSSDEATPASDVTSAEASGQSSRVIPLTARIPQKSTAGSVETVTLSKGGRGGGGLGLLLTGGDESDIGGIFISSIVAAGAAASDGRIQVGDRLLSVDGTSMDGKTHSETVEIISTSQRTLDLEVQHLGQAQWQSIQDSMASVKQGDSGKRVAGKNDEFLIFQLSKGPEESWGLALSSKQHEVKNVMPGGEAERKGIIRGDIITTVNEVSVAALSHADVLNLIKSSQNSMTVHIRRRAKRARKSKSPTKVHESNATGDPIALLQLQQGSMSPATTGISMDSSSVRVFTVTLAKGQGDVGLGISCAAIPKSKEDGGGHGIIINKISPNGVIARYPEIRCNDEIIAIDGQSLAGITPPKLKELMSSSASSLTLDLQRVEHERERAGRLAKLAALGELQASASVGESSTDGTGPVENNSKSQLDDDLLSDESVGLPPPIPPSGPLPTTDEDDADDFPAAPSMPPPESESPDINFDDDDDDDALLPVEGNAAPRKLSIEDLVGNPFGQALNSEKSKRLSTGSDVATAEVDLVGNPFATVSRDSVDPNSIAGEVNPSIVWNRLRNHFQKCVEDKVYVREWKALREMEYGLTFDTCDANKALNRYTDVKANERTRVMLTTADDNDYINANHVIMPVSNSSQRHFILCQGPMPRTIGHFWRMAWEQKASGIVMVTGEVEMGRVKCAGYWPHAAGETEQYDEFAIQNIEVQDYDSFQITFLRIINSQTQEQPRNITHLRFKAWPDHGVPAAAAPFLDFVEETENYTTRTSPLIVHCSAGIGRSGVFTVVMVAKEMAQNHDVQMRIQTGGDDGVNAISIKDLTKTARLQRNQFVVQRDVQYKFCYTAFIEVLERLSQSEESGEEEEEFA